MSPTSYQTAPPRGASVRITEAGREQNRGLMGVATIGAVEDQSALVEEVGHRLARAGLRWTAGRRAVVAIFESAQAPLSMQDLQDRARAARVPLSSLYRIVSDLVAANVLVRLEFEEGFARFELVEELARHHHHLVCVECGTVEDFEGPGLPDLERAVDDAMRSIVRRHRFAVRNHRLDFFGTCATCTGP